jgi:hypothetical protein
MEYTWSGIFVMLLIVTIFLYLFIHPPILKPWFGLRKPKGHSGKWFE